MNLMVLSCQKAGQLIEKKQVKNLTILEKLQLNVHLRICERCADYEKQSVLIDAMLKKHPKQALNGQEIRLSDEIKQRIQKELDKRIKK